MFKKYRLRDFDFKLILMLIGLSVIGCLAVGSAEPSLQNKQMAGLAAGVFIMLVVAMFDYKWVLKFYWLIYAVNLLLLLLVIVAGDDSGGAQRWLLIGDFRFQPSETAKILLILFFAQFIMLYKKYINTFKIISLCVLLILVPWIMIALQPDLSTSIVLLVVFCVLMFAGGISYKLIFSLLAVAVPAVVIVVYLAIQPEPNFVNKTLMRGYQSTRIMAFFYPDEYADHEAYQQLNSVMAIGSGQLDGKGYKNNEITSVKNGNFISEPQTDFIFAVIGEEFGFKGSVTVIVLLFAIALECASIARRASDTAGTIIAAGMGGLVAFQGFFNIGVTTFLLPNTGLPLPFVSYGLTSLWSLYIGMGFVLNVRLQARKERN